MIKKFIYIMMAASLITLSACASTSSHSAVKTSQMPAKEYKAVASWYGKPFHGRKTANGERYNMFALTAAHKTLPFGTRLLVTNLDTQKSVMVRINDRGPYIKGREIDLSYAAAIEIGMIGTGTAKVSIQFLPEEDEVALGDWSNTALEVLIAQSSF